MRKRNNTIKVNSGYNQYDPKSVSNPVMLELSKQEIQNYEKKRKKETEGISDIKPERKEYMMTRLGQEMSDINDLGGKLSVGHTYDFLRYANMKKFIPEGTELDIEKLKSKIRTVLAGMYTAIPQEDPRKTCEALLSFVDNPYYINIMTRYVDDEKKFEQEMKNIKSIIDQAPKISDSEEIKIKR